MNRLPAARTGEIVEQDLGSELLIYDLTNNRAYTLNQTSKTVFKACGDGRIFEDLKREFKFTDDLIHLTLGELQKNNLLEGNYISPFAGLSRREVIRRVGFACAAALPVIASLTAPFPAEAATDTCSSNVCFRAEFLASTNVCAGCAGRTVTLTSYNSRDGTCSGNARFSFNQSCPANGDTVYGTNRDLRRT